MADYVPPSWASEPSKDIELEILKGGVVIGRTPLTKSHHTIGRIAAADFVLEHPSISRSHAILQFGNPDGALHIFDNNSTHGTYVNKIKLETKRYHRLNVGDVIRFGESTRLYAVCGPEELMPEEYDSENLKNLRMKLNERTQRKAARLLQNPTTEDAAEDAERDDNNVSWGMREDAVNEDSESGDGSDSDEDLPEYLKTDSAKAKRKMANIKAGLETAMESGNDGKAFQKLQKKLQKIENLMLENDRISAKEGAQGGLTDGQQAQMDRNVQSITAIREEIETIEESIREKNKQRKASAAPAASDGSTKPFGAGGDASDEESFYDRTQKVKDKSELKARRFGTGKAVKSVTAASASSAGAKAQTYESLSEQHSQLEARLQEVNDAIQQAQINAAGIQPDEAQIDPLDQFMVKNAVTAHEQHIKDLQSEQEGLKTELKQVSSLLKLVRPALPVLQSQAVQKVQPVSPIKSPKRGRNESDVAEITAEPQEEEASLEEEPSVKKIKTTHISEKTEDVTPHSVDEQQELKQAEVENQPADEFVLASSTGPKEGEKRKKGPQKRKGPMKGPAAITAEAAAEGWGLEDKFVPPKNQTGDGRTSLNEKLGY